MLHPSSARWRRGLALDGLVLGLACLLVWPLLRSPGLPLARDLVFTPSQPFRLAWLGLGDTPARAVPLDALVSIADAVVGGAVLARIAILGILVLAGCAAHRLLRGAHPAARAVAGAFAVWNPFVVERLALGQWALLAAYAAGFVIVASASRLRDLGTSPREVATRTESAVARPGPAAYGPLLVGMALSAITPTGALVGAFLAVVVGWSRRTAAALLALAMAVQLPWLLPSLLGPAGLASDPGGVAAFAARAERPGGAVWSLLGLGGIWDAGSVPASRSGAFGHAGTVLVLVALVAGWVRLTRLVGPVTARRLAAVAGLGLIAAVASSLPGGATLVRAVVEGIPGAGLLRDSHKWLLPLALLAVLALGAAADRALRGVGRHAPALLVTAAVVAVGLPIVALPDATTVTWPTVRPVRYPTDFERVAAIVDGSSGTLVTLPWQAYRVYPWGSPLAVYDPASRWFDVDVVMSDRLRVGTTLLTGESDRAQEVGAVVEGGSPARAADLGRLGVRWVLVQADAPPGAAAIPVETPKGAVQRYAGAHLTLYEIPGPVTVPDGSAGPAVTALVVSVDVLVGLLVMLLGGASVLVATRRRSGRHGRRAAAMLPATQRGSGRCSRR
ncbi:hypothetical protein N865_00660 [Intrasporangium oryzae NRRL B-24470]|uniref:Uncharacterized protein n=1 Tax=Intrasporangium oryzae NRRL B-24470 TaxID=1386089 RepID=W9G9V4_9MICO|nr:hypothetical protein [Intrasporangium oryzae]EWT02981.1 hypothetical protein N865_00660 [Intrasporangium oryzae NRRL B-24470]